MQDEIFLKFEQLPKGSWQQDMHKKGMKFHGPAASNNGEIKRQNEAIEAARIGRTIVESYGNGEIAQIENYGTCDEVVKQLRAPHYGEPFRPTTEA